MKRAPGQGALFQFLNTSIGKPTNRLANGADFSPNVSGLAFNPLPINCTTSGEPANFE